MEDFFRKKVFLELRVKVKRTDDHETATLEFPE